MEGDSRPRALAAAPGGAGAAAGRGPGAGAGLRRARCSPSPSASPPTRSGVHWGAPAQPLTVLYLPTLSTWALPGLAAGRRLAGAGAVPLLRSRLGVVRLRRGAFGLTLATRVGLNVFRAGPRALDEVFVVRASRRGTDRVPARPRLLRTTASAASSNASPTSSPSPPTHVAGHPPGLVLTMHLLGIDTAAGLAALHDRRSARWPTPVLYLLGRQLFGETEGRVAALLFVFVPTSLLYGATSGRRPLRDPGAGRRGGAARPPPGRRGCSAPLLPRPRLLLLLRAARRRRLGGAGPLAAPGAGRRGAGGAALRRRPGRLLPGALPRHRLRPVRRDRRHRGPLPRRDRRRPPLRLLLLRLARRLRRHAGAGRLVRRPRPRPPRGDRGGARRS